MSAYAKEGRGTSDARIGVTRTKADSLLHTLSDILDRKVQLFNQREGIGIIPAKMQSAVLNYLGFGLWFERSLRVRTLGHVAREDLLHDLLVKSLPLLRRHCLAPLVVRQ